MNKHTILLTDEDVEELKQRVVKLQAFLSEGRSQSLFYMLERGRYHDLMDVSSMVEAYEQSLNCSAG